MSVPEPVVRARETGEPLRVHTKEGEVLVARVLSYDETELICLVLRSSRPERYAVCDSTGSAIPFSAIERLIPVRERRGKPAPEGQEPDPTRSVER